MKRRGANPAVAWKNRILRPESRPGSLKIHLLAVTTCVLVSGCTPFPPPVPTVLPPPAESSPPSPREAKTPPVTPPGVMDALLPPLSEEPHTLDAGGPRFDIAVTHAPAREFFASLVAGTDWNMVLHPEVRGEISLTLKNVTVGQAVETACEIYGFDCQFREGGFRIFPRQYVSRTYRVDFLPVVRQGISTTLISSGSSPRSLRERGPRIDEKREGTKTGEIGVVEKGQGSVSTSIDTSYHSDFWGELQAVLKSMLRLDRATMVKDAEGGVTMVRQADDENGRSVMVNRQAGLLMVRALPSEQREVEAYLEQLKERTFRQVILEAKVVEVELNDGFRFGIDWLAISQGLGKSLPPLIGEPGNGSAFLANPISPNTPGYVVSRDGSAPYPQNLAAIFSKRLGGPFSLATRAHDFTAFLSMLQSQGKVQVLSSPRVAAVNNQKAVIKVGEDASYLTDVDYEVTTTISGNVIETADPEFANYFSGVSLDVTPQIGEGGMVTLHIHPIVADVREHTLLVENHTYPLARSRTRETDNVIRARNGEVVVIGGLMKRDVRETQEKVPLLGDLPVLGRLFTQTNQETVKSELVILLRPVLVENRDEWRATVSQTGQRLRAMGVDPRDLPEGAP